MTNEESEKEAQRLENLMKAGNKMKVIRHMAEANDAITEAIKSANRSISLYHFSKLNEIRESIEQLAFELISKA